MGATVESEFEVNFQETNLSPLVALIRFPAVEAILEFLLDIQSHERMRNCQKWHTTQKK